MQQKKCIKVSGVKLSAACLAIVIAGLMMSAATPAVNAQTRYTAPPTNWYLDIRRLQDKLFPDYVVEFTIPANAINIVVYMTTAGIESRVLAFSTEYPPEPKNEKKS